MSKEKEKQKKYEFLKYSSQKTKKFAVSCTEDTEKKEGKRLYDSACSRARLDFFNPQSVVRNPQYIDILISTGRGPGHKTRAASSL